MDIKNISEKYNYFLTQSSLKDMERKESCPVRWRHKWLLKDIEDKDTLPQLYGNYFETLALGSDVRGTQLSEIIEKIPTNKNGSKKAEVIRIEEQAEYCKRMLFDESFEEYLKIKPISIQHVLVSEKKKRGVIDYVGEDDNGVVLVDIKLTGDVYNDFGTYAWANVDKMDLIQQAHYQMLYESKYGVPVSRNVLAVFDYSTKRGKRIIGLLVSDQKKIDCKNRFDALEEVIPYYEENGWPYIPSYSECKDCPLKCKYRFTGEEPIYEEIII